MTKILTTDQIRALDAYVIKHEPIASIDLMERASQQFVDWLEDNAGDAHCYGIVCGTGNNGGDGLAIARLLVELDYDVKVWIVEGGKPSADFEINRARLPEKVEVHMITGTPAPGIFDWCTLLVDALFGSGLSRPLEGIYADVIDCINAAEALCVAVDIPSGLRADGPSQGAIVRATDTISFQVPKLAFFFASSARYIGDWHTVNIVPWNLCEDFFEKTETDHHVVDNVYHLKKHREKFSHKGTYGHALLVAGSYGKMGAAILAARALLRAGVGLLTIHTPARGYAILQQAVPEAMVSIDPLEDYASALPSSDGYSVIGIGPGLGQADVTVKMMHKILEAYRKPMVIDADALNILAAHRELLSLVPPGSILTPHPKEFERLAGKTANEFERLEKQKALARQLRSVVVVKGAYSSIASPEGVVYFNTTGNPGMATGGTGDVLTGILTGLLAQSYPSLDAAILGVYLHGLAGDLAAHKLGVDSLIASDLIRYLPAAFRKI
ncbi:NAD(P)H-hydrate dehydratase [Dawidia soli]|uniref:Bifunctional NAD(P)H-hydrate repair enzyme n=1 Tax=Dawidia soli TaxID=2782352 RepID=A0AAP2DB49_9BACT|nr:NAD(P)H-hydrate dehydratase [Dawidia soli]MBT1687851.1 NAD(P)H-hydrate dehydratase [Dawidia soli]